LKAFKKITDRAQTRKLKPTENKEEK